MRGAEDAARYAAKGWPIFPIKPRGKEPLTLDGFKSATTEEAVVGRWWTTWPDANIGFVPGRLQRLVLDLDGPEGERVAQELGLLSEPTLTVLTARGQHLYFQHPGGHIGNQPLAPHVDVRADAGYVLLPPSVHPSGAVYRWVDEDEEVRALPPAVVALFQGARRPSSVTVAASEGKVSHGQRNSYLFSRLGVLRAGAFSVPALRAAMEAENLARCDPPLDPKELDKILASIQRYPPGGNGAAPDEPLALRLKTVAELLADPNILAPPEPVAPRLAWRGYVSLLFGREKAAGKSTLLMAAAAAVTQGVPFLGESTLEGAVLWVSADQESASLLVGRALRFGAIPERLHILWPGAAPFEELQQATSQVNPVWIVIDTLANFARVQQPKDAGEWPDVLLPLVRLARDEARALTLAHHARKAEEGGYRDSTAIGASVDVLLELRPVSDASPTQRRLTAIGRWTLDDASLDLAGEVYQLMASGQASLDARIISFVQANPGCSHNAVTQALDARRESVWRAINTLVAGGLLIRRTSDSHVHQLWIPKAAPPL